jgi:hypothetical protein
MAITMIGAARLAKRRAHVADTWTRVGVVVILLGL